MSPDNDRASAPATEAEAQAAGTSSRPRLTLLGEGELRRLHGAALVVLADTGVNVHHAAMRRLLLSEGAVGGDGARVFLPPVMVESALASAKKEVTVHDRGGRPTLPLAPHRCYFGTGSDLLYILDPDSGARRPARLDDVAQAARLSDALPEIDFIMSSALPGDVPGDDVEPRQYYAMVSNSTKPPIMTSFSGLPVLERMHSMACAVAGSEEAFRERPNYMLYGQFVSPLQHDANAVERLIFCADHAVPLIYIPTIMPGVSGPMTLFGSLALAAAESLAGLVMQQARQRGSPFIFGACVGAMDMTTMLFTYGSAEWRLSDLALAELARFYGLPVFGTGGASDAKRADAQAGAEYASGLLVAALAGTNLIHDVGYLESGRTGSLESILLGAESIRWVKRFAAGVDTSDESLAAEVVSEVGPGQHFLDRQHTLKHLRRSLALPYAADRDVYENWAQKGARSYADRARHEARALADGHRPQPLSPGLDARLRQTCHADEVPPR